MGKITINNEEYTGLLGLLLALPIMFFAFMLIVVVYKDSEQATLYAKLRQHGHNVAVREFNKAMGLDN